MVENADIYGSVLKTVASSKELAEHLQEEASMYESSNTTFPLGVGTARTIASQLRITANLIEGLTRENRELIRQIAELKSK